MKIRDALTLGRVSNLPTVWTNTLAGIVLAGGVEFTTGAGWLLLAMSLFYVAGMYLNDAFDAQIDAVERPERPIPAGRVARSTVVICGLVMLCVGLLCVVLASQHAFGQVEPLPLVTATALIASIVYYDWRHKSNPLSPLIMGLCRLLVYVTAGLCISLALPWQLYMAAAVLLCYLIGLTYIAKQENLGEVANLWPLIFLAVPLVYGVVQATQSPLTGAFVAVFFVWMVIALYFVKRRNAGDIPRAVVSLIAGISLLDAVIISGAGSTSLALVAVGGFLATLAFQRLIPGT